MNFEIDLLTKLLLACFFGGAVGYTRERDRKAAGLRTHIMVCMGAALFTISSIYMAHLFPKVDPSRIASMVVSGAGFLGAGAIIREGGSVRGLTTASSMWVVAAIGIALGCGMMLTAGVATLITIVVLKTLSLFEAKYMREEKKQ